MGTSTSKTTSSSCCSASTSPPVTKLNSKFPSVHHPPAKEGDTHHLVSLTSTTYGSLLMTDLDQASKKQTLSHFSLSGPEPRESRDSLSPDSVINTWELMNGLDDLCVKEEEEDWFQLPSKSKQPLWKHMAEESFLSDLDPNIVSSYKRALSSKQPGKGIKPVSCSYSTLEEEKKLIKSETEDNKEKIVLYFTSLRGIRKTYEDCCYVRTMLRGFHVAVEERDISMDSRYKKELQIALGEERPVCLPQVFIRGVHIGGVEEIKKLNDGGELGEMLKGLPICESMGACGCCGDARFVLCTSCGGSTKVFEEQEDVFKRCSGCNENGLVRCKECCL